MAFTLNKLPTGEIALPAEDAQRLAEWIRSQLYTQWDHYTDVYICRDTMENGMRRMDPEMYEFAAALKLAATS